MSADTYKKHFLDWLENDAEQNRTLRNTNEENNKPSSQSDIAFENEDLKLIVEKAAHKHQKNFSLQDHLFYFKIEQKSAARMPLLTNILDFLHAAFIHVLDSIKQFYKPGNISNTKLPNFK